MPASMCPRPTDSDSGVSAISAILAILERGGGGGAGSTRLRREVRGQVLVHTSQCELLGNLPTSPVEAGEMVEVKTRHRVKNLK